MVLLPVAMYGLQVPAGNIMIPATGDFPATFRITMAAVDPTEEVSSELASRSTLKIVRFPITPEDEEDDDEDSDDEEYMRALLDGSDDEDDSEDEAGPSDPSKSKQAKKQAAIAELMAAVKQDAESSDDEMADVDTKVSKKGKAKALANEDSEGDSDEESEDDEDLEMEEFVICTLDTEKNHQQTLDITIGEDEQVYFKVTGNHTVYLTGNYLVPDDNGHNHHHEVYDSDEDEDYDLSPDEDELDEDEDESDELDDLEDPRIEELDSDDEEEAPELVKADKKGKNKRAAEDEAENLDDMMAAAKPEEKLSKKQLKKQKKNNGEAVATKDESKDNKKVQFAKNLEQGPTGSTTAEAKPAPKGALGTRVIKGVKIEDKKVGSGPAAKNGDRVGMRYIGKLTDGKVFDSNKKGKPFSFKLGKGEVIQGWDIGVAGMTVGGERRITIPANMAYGSKALPGIPSNSILVFDIKLLEIK